ncbi:MAG TPA: paraquat-inducible protein A [Usitatibacter sp.]|jgi:paraquat-inducible protein A
MSATALRSGLLVCQSCNLICRPLAHCDESDCPRCGEGLHPRKPDSLVRAWTFFALASILYIPANTLPALESTTLLSFTSATIMGGVRVFWRDGDYMIATIIFVASIVVPVAKLLAMGTLLATAQARSTWLPRRRARLYRIVHTIGRWSMVDIYVGGLLVALVQFNTIGEVTIGPASLPFAMVVVLTLFCSLSFDPRLIWDPLDDPQ